LLHESERATLGITSSKVASWIIRFIFVDLIVTNNRSQSGRKED